MTMLTHRMLVLLALVAMTSVVFAQRGQGNYDPSTEVTIAGVVDEVVHMPATGKGPGGIHLMVRAPAGVFDVHLGPASFVSSQKFEFAKGDTLTVLGSQQKWEGSNVLIARAVVKANRTLTLRDAKGLPAWSGKAAQ